MIAYVRMNYLYFRLNWPSITWVAFLVAIALILVSIEGQCCYYRRQVASWIEIEHWTQKFKHSMIYCIYWDHNCAEETEKYVRAAHNFVIIQKHHATQPKISTQNHALHCAKLFTLNVDHLKRVGTKHVQQRDFPSFMEMIEFSAEDLNNASIVDGCLSTRRVSLSRGSGKMVERTCSSSYVISLNRMTSESATTPMLILLTWDSIRFTESRVLSTSLSAARWFVRMTSKRRSATWIRTVSCQFCTFNWIKVVQESILPTEYKDCSNEAQVDNLRITFARLDIIDCNWYKTSWVKIKWSELHQSQRKKISNRFINIKFALPELPENNRLWCGDGCWISRRRFYSTPFTSVSMSRLRKVYRVDSECTEFHQRVHKWFNDRGGNDVAWKVQAYGHLLKLTGCVWWRMMRWGEVEDKNE